MSITLAKRSGIVIISLQTHFFSKFINNKEKSALIIKIINMKKVLIASGVAVLAFAMIAGAQGYTFNSNLTVGSTGADVVALQTALMAAGHNIPAIASGAAAKGYFGSQTKTAVQAYQASKSIPTTGFVGPMTRGALNGGALAVSNCLSGWTSVSYQGAQVCLPPGYTLPGSTPVGTNPTPAPGVVSTPGAEGTLSVTQSNAGVSSTVYEGQTMAAILGFDVEAKNSDILVQRVKLDLGTETKIYNKIYSKVYLVDGNTVLSSLDLNSSTVVKDGSRYTVTFSGFSALVSKNTKKNLTVKVDVRPSIDSTDLSSNYTITLWTTQAVRGVDGAGIDQYAGTSAITKTINVDGSLAESATLKISTNTATQKTVDVVAAEGSDETQYSKLPVLTFDLKAEKDSVMIKDLTVDITKSGTGGATASSTVYLYEGSTEIDNASYSSGSALFSDIDLTVNKDSTRTFTVMVDVDGANGTVSQIAADVDTADVVSENMAGDSITESGSATGETMYVRNLGPIFALVSKSATRTSLSSNDTSGIATSTGTGKFSLTIKAVGGDISFGSAASTTPAFATTSTTVASVYRNSVANGTVAANTAGGTTAKVSYSTPSSGVTVSGETWTLQEGNTVTLDVEYQVTVAGSEANSYAFQMNGVRWYTTTTGQQTSTSMTDKADWRTSSVSLP